MRMNGQGGICLSDVMTIHELQPTDTILDDIRNKLSNCCKENIVFLCENCGNVHSIPLRCDLILCSRCGLRRFKRLKEKYRPAIRQGVRQYKSVLQATERKCTAERLECISIKDSSSTKVYCSQQYKSVLPESSNISPLKLLTLTWRKETTEKSEIRIRHNQVRTLIKKYFSGSLYVFEGLAQHVHALVIGGYVPASVISKAWRKITNDSYIVNIKRANVNGLDYILKYVCKSPTDDESQFKVYYRFWFHNRRVSATGIFYNFKYVKVVFDLLCVKCQNYLVFWSISDSVYDYPILQNRKSSTN